MTLKTFLRVTKSIGYTDANVTKVEVETSVNTGIRWGTISNDYVPFFEEQISRLERGYSVSAWLDLEPLERAMVIAVRRIDNAMKNIQAEAEIRAMKRKSNQST